MIIDRDSEPKDTIYYASGCILLSLGKNNADLDSLFQDVTENYHSSMDYTIFLLALDFLFLLNKIVISKKGVLKCI